MLFKTANLHLFKEEKNEHGSILLVMCVTNILLQNSRSVLKLSVMQLLAKYITSIGAEAVFYKCESNGFHLVHFAVLK